MDLIVHEHLLGFGWGLLAAGGMAALLALSILATGRWPSRPVWLLALSATFFVGITMLPLPDPARLACPIPSAEPNFVPLAKLQAQWARFEFLRSHSSGLPASVVASGLLGALLNVLFCIPIGYGLRRCGLGAGATVAAGAGLSLAVELTQLTGNWWLYPCAFRMFDADDLLTNTLGAALGAALAGAAWRAPRRASA